ncbi:MAG: sporulation protein YqfD [Oscillospiraceae bacterium]|jgi:similar to stage IV sporulation protein|nr:sporulation protein YqfD [Oscillospiraceae bacterium]
MKSYIVVSVLGSYNEAFVNNLIKSNIKVWEIKNKDGVIYFNMSPYFYKKIARAAFNSGVRTRVEERHGAYFKLRRYKNRYGVFFGAVSFLGIIVLMSNFVWDIRVHGNESLSASQIIEVMEKHGITNGVNIHDYDSEKAELALALELDRLAWVNIERQGSRINVNVSERLETEDDKIPVTVPCNIVAVKTGIIIETEVYRGRLLIEPGSGVSRGEVIVSGVVDDGAGNIILSHASAKIIAECEEITEFFVPFISLERRNNGRISKNNFIVFLGRGFPLFLIDSKPEDAAFSEEMRAPAFLGLRLPFRLKTEVYAHYDFIEVTLGQAQVLERLKKQIELHRQNFYGDSEIISFDEKYIMCEEGITAEVRVVYRTDIAQQRIIGVP